MHGLSRLPHLQEFADGLVRMFADTALPAMLVRAFGLALVFVEVAVGLLLLAGIVDAGGAAGRFGNDGLAGVRDGAAFGLEYRRDPAAICSDLCGAAGCAGIQRVFA